MAKKVLYVATVVKTHIMTFHLPFLKMFQERGYRTAVAARNDYDCPEDCAIPYCDTFYDIPFARSPLGRRNLTAYRALKQILAADTYDIIHCHTPVGSVLARLAARKYRNAGTKVIYTAHGFHFYRGAPLTNWLLYYPVEKLCARFTDVLITINREDYDLARKKMKAKQVEYVPGVGIDTARFPADPTDRNKIRAEIGVPEAAQMLLSVGELNRNKNHAAVLRAIALMGNPAVHYVIAGQGEHREALLALSQALNIPSQLHLLGYRQDIAALHQAADLFVFPSLREGLSVSVMEAMASGKPCAVSRIRGNTDLIDERGGVFFDPENIEDCRNAIETLLSADREAMGAYNREKIKAYSVESIKEQLLRILQL